MARTTRAIHPVCSSSVPSCPTNRQEPSIGIVSPSESRPKAPTGTVAHAQNRVKQLQVLYFSRSALPIQHIVIRCFCRWAAIPDFNTVVMEGHRWTKRKPGISSPLARANRIHSILRVLRALCDLRVKVFEPWPKRPASPNDCDTI